MSTEVRVLGSVVAVAGDAAVVEIGAPNQARLLSHLTATRGLATDELIDRVWDGQPPSTARSALQVHLAKIRQRVESAGLEDPVVTVPGGYELSDRVRVDVDDFTAAVRRAVIGTDPLSRLTDARFALGRWQGTPYRVIADHPGLRPEVARLRELAAQGRQVIVEALLDLGRADEAIIDAGILVSEDPLRERGVELQMLARYRAGDPNGALRAFAEFREILADTLGTAPGPSIRSLEERMLFGDPDLLDPRRRPSPDHNLPADVRLIGRGPDIDAVESVLSSAPVVTIVGPPGVGKSALAIAVAHRCLEQFPSGVHRADASASPDASDLRARIAAAQWGIGDDVDHRLRSVVRAPGLLLIDGADEPHAAGVVREFAAERAAVLATAHAPLGISGERIVELGPLEVPRPSDDPVEIAANATVRLLVERLPDELLATTAGPDQLRRLAVVAAETDGLPFAVELAAGWLPVIGLEEAPPPTTMGPVAAAIARIGPDERLVLDALAQFSGRVPLEAVVALTPVLRPGRRISALRRVVSRSLATVRVGDDGHARYRLLAPIRTHILANGEDTDMAALRDAWLDRWAADLRTSMATASEQSTFAAIEGLMPDIEAHWSRCLANGRREPVAMGASAMWRFWFASFRVQSGIRWLERALDGSLPDEIEAPAANALGWLTWLDDRWEDALGIFDRGLAAARRVGDREREGLIEYDAAVAMRSGGRWDEGTQRLWEAERLLAEVGHRHGLASARTYLASDDIVAGDLDAAIERAQSALALAADEADPTLIGSIEWTIGHALRRQGHYDAASERGRRVLGAADQAGSVPLRVSARLLLSLTAAQAGDLRAASEHLADAAGRLPRRSEIDMSRLLLASFPSLSMAGEDHLAMLVAARVRATYGVRLERLPDSDALSAAPSVVPITPPSAQELVDRVVEALSP